MPVGQSTCPIAQSSRTSSNAVSYDALDAYIQQQLDRLHVPGAAVAIVEGDQLVHQRGFGHAQRNGASPTPQTPFVLGSLTKSFTALAVMQLVEAGNIGLDTSGSTVLAMVLCRGRAASANDRAPLAEPVQRPGQLVRLGSHGRL